MKPDRPLWHAWWAEGRPGSFSSDGFMAAMAEWVSQKGHSGPEPSRKMAEYTALNAVRMRRVAKTHVMSPEMQHLLDSGACDGQHWVIITESWCGDGAQTTPIIRKLAERAGVPVYWVLRDSGTTIIDDFLINGGRSVPIWVVADGGGQVLGHWGPRPSTAAAMAAEYRSAPQPREDYDAFSTRLQLWYARNRGKEFEQEALDMLLGIA